MGETLRDLWRASKGGADFRSLAFVIQVGPREHKIGLAGGYRRRPAEVNAALRLLERKLRWESSFQEIA